jgi:hypothetical protein
MPLLAMMVPPKRTVDTAKAVRAGQLASELSDLVRRLAEVSDKLTEEMKRGPGFSGEPAGNPERTTEH